jgi:MFS family permease
VQPDGQAATTVVRALVPSVYVPFTLAGVGTGMLIPVLPLYLTDLGVSFTATAIVLAAAGLGAAVGGLPAGAAVGRFGERRLLEGSLVAMGLTAALAGWVTAVAALVALRLVYGAGSIGLRLASQTHITRVVIITARGRAMATMGGSIRLAFLVGPLLGGWMVEVAGYRATFAVIGAVAAIGLLAARQAPLAAAEHHLPRRSDQVPSSPAFDGAVSPAQAGSAASTDAAPPEPERLSMATALRRHHRLLLRGGIGPALVMTVREGRNVVVPLVAIGLDLSPAQVGAVVAVGTGADLLLFPLSGYVMDRYGRLMAMIPAFGLFAVGLFVLAGAESASIAVLAGVIMGVGNGLSAGTMLTLGSDLAPADAPGQFLAAMAAMQDSGKIAGPLLVGWMADSVGLGASSTALGVAMIAGLAWIVFLIGETGTVGETRPARR